MYLALLIKKYYTRGYSTLYFSERYEQWCSMRPIFFCVLYAVSERQICSAEFSSLGIKDLYVYLKSWQINLPIVIL